MLNFFRDVMGWLHSHSSVLIWNCAGPSTLEMTWRRSNNDFGLPINNESSGKPRKASCLLCYPEMAGEERSGYSISTDAESASVDLKPSFASVKKERSYSQVDTRQKKGCIPLFFERASSRWWKPSFDSKILEEEFQRFTAHNQRRLIHALMFICLVCVTWGIFFAVLYFGDNTKAPTDKEELKILIIGDACFLVLVIALMLFTKFSRMYKKCASLVSLLASVLLIAMELSLFAFTTPH